MGYRWVFFILLAGIVSCQKPPGEGGRAFVRGKVSKELRLILSNPATKQYVVPAADEDVYIIYGDHTSADDRIKTNYDGEFEFRNLREGKYEVYLYSNDTTGLIGVDPKKMPIRVSFEITNKDQVFKIPELTIYDKN